MGLLGDGIFDKWDTPDIVDAIWGYVARARESGLGDSRTRLCEGVVNHVITSSMRRLSYDNLTGIFLNFNAF